LPFLKNKFKWFAAPLPIAATAVAAGSALIFFQTGIPAFLIPVAGNIVLLSVFFARAFSGMENRFLQRITSASFVFLSNIIMMFLVVSFKNQRVWLIYFSSLMLLFFTLFPHVYNLNRHKNIFKAFSRPYIVFVFFVLITTFSLLMGKADLLYAVPFLTMLLFVASVVLISWKLPASAFAKRYSSTLMLMLFTALLLLADVYVFANRKDFPAISFPPVFLFTISYMAFPLRSIFKFMIISLLLFFIFVTAILIAPTSLLVFLIMAATIITIMRAKHFKIGERRFFSAGRDGTGAPASLLLKCALAALVSSVFFSIYYVVPIFFYNCLSDKNIRVLKPVTISESRQSKRVAYTIFLDADRKYLYSTYCHSSETGFGRINLQSGRKNWIQFTRHGDDNPCYATLIPGRNIAIVHNFFPTVIRSSSAMRMTPATHVVDLEAFKSVTIRNDRMRMPFRSVYVPRDETLYILDKDTAELVAVNIDGFLSNDYRNARFVKVESDFALDGILWNSEKNVLYIRGEAGPLFKEYNIKTRSFRGLYAPLETWDIALDQKKNFIYITRPFDYGVMVVDASSFKKIRNIWLKGLTRSVVALPEYEAFAVGMYFGGKVILLDNKTFKPIYYVESCSRVRSMAYDRHEGKLYFTDTCGIKMVAIPDRKPTTGKR
jgi:hypothetical protein